MIQSIRKETHMRARAVLALIVLTSALCSCSGEAAVIIEDRWWVAQTLVQYTDIDIDVSVDSDGLPHTSVTSSTVTRCRATETGRDLPEHYPLPACAVWNGDRISHVLSCYISYHEQETAESVIRQIVPSLWHEVEPGTEAKIAWNVLGIVDEASTVLREIQQ